ncbi:hypothetical protein OKA05_21100 [Luteolibacter arcticus]|uniref:XRE family transcriptional regulator n=1 Tax=Luteolibacter arcticus TaxID=1581411 RepID=A0ABT3GNI1_9BACT|nr:hypothetical protein [Luteolibacter arcticus]MCW1925072.1 hypothetical protein [Luteolibacter arcticus]
MLDRLLRRRRGMQWDQIGAQLHLSGSPTGRIDETSDYGRFLGEVEKMSGPQLIAAYDELVDSDVPGDVKIRLQAQLIGKLVGRDTEFALERFSDYLREPSGETGALLIAGFNDWAVKSPVKAELWLDARIEDGSLDGGSGQGEVPVRVLYERGLIRSLLMSRPDQAGARLEALPEGSRALALRGNDMPQSQAAYAKLVRQYLPAAEQEGDFVRMAVSARYMEGEEGVAKLLDRISATAVEREAIRKRVAGQGGAGVPPVR